MLLFQDESTNFFFRFSFVIKKSFNLKKFTLILQDQNSRLIKTLNKIKMLLRLIQFEQYRLIEL